MRFSAIAATALAAAPAVSAVGSMGFALGTKKADGSCKSQQDYEDDFTAIDTNTGGQAKVVRGYAASDCDFAKNILPAAKSKGFKVVLGIWPDVEESFNNDLKAITDMSGGQYKDAIYAVTVGSETMYRGNFTGAELKDKINTVKSKVGGDIKVGTADSWNKYADGTADAIYGTADIIMINAFAFWQSATMDNATHVYLDDMYQAVKHIEGKVGKDKMPEIWNGETGWPTAVGTDYGDSKGGKENAATFYKNGFCALLDWGFNAFYFEAFDEPWKPDSVGDNGKAASEKTWGAMTSDRQAKFNLKC